MSRPGYINYHVTENRERWLAEIAERLGLSDSHRDRVKIIDYALMRVVEREETPKMFARKLTEREIEQFRGDSSVDCCIYNGSWWYGDSNPTEDDPEGLAGAQFVSNEGGDYIPFPSHPIMLTCGGEGNNAFRRVEEEYGEDHHTRGIRLGCGWYAKPELYEVLIAKVRVRAHDPTFSVFQYARG